MDKLSVSRWQPKPPVCRSADLQSALDLRLILAVARIQTGCLVSKVTASMHTGGGSASMLPDCRAVSGTEQLPPNIAIGRRAHPAGALSTVSAWQGHRLMAPAVAVPVSAR